MRTFLRDLQRMEKAHARGDACCEQSREWKTGVYGWHNPRFPPEYRMHCLRGEAFEADFSCDLYYYAACYYERATGQRAPYNFELDHVWRTRLAEYFTEQEILLRNAAENMIADCTRWRSQKRMPNARELLKTDYMKIFTGFF